MGAALVATGRRWVHVPFHVHILDLFLYLLIYFCGELIFGHASSGFYADMDVFYLII